jgi:membrane-associated phospholipid phosphatase
LVADALIRSRAGTVGDDPPLLRNVTMPPIDDVANLEKWEPIVRFYVCLSELLGDLKFVVDAHTSTATLSAVTSARAIMTMVRPDSVVFERQISLVNAWAELREDRATEIQAEMPPQVPFWSATCGLQPGRHRFTHEFINLALALAAISAFRFKQAFACPRPNQYWSGLQPMIPTPEHSSLPSGHATEAFMAAHVLSALNGIRYDCNGVPIDEGLYQELLAQASRVAINRTVAGLHFPIDSIAGSKLGSALSEYLLVRARQNQLCVPRSFERTDWINSPDYLQTRPLHTFEQYATPLRPVAGPIPTAGSAIAWLYEKAKAEWK